MNIKVLKKTVAELFGILSIITVFIVIPIAALAFAADNGHKILAFSGLGVYIIGGVGIVTYFLNCALDKDKE